MIGLGLTAEQRQNRRQFIGASDAPVVAGGDRDALLTLFLEKTGDLPAEGDPTWTRYMQEVVEAAACNWVEVFGARDSRGVQAIPKGPITRRGEQPRHPILPFIGCTLDGWCEALKCPVNVKHLSKWTGKKQGQTALEWAIAHYTVSTIHEALATEALFGFLLLVVDGQEPVAQRVDVDPWFSDDLIAKERAFWQCVETKTPPEGTSTLVAPKVEAAQLRHINLMNEADKARCQWAGEFIDLGRKFADTEPAHKAHMACRDTIKALLPDDVGFCEFGRFKVSRTKAGAVQMRLDPMQADNER